VAVKVISELARAVIVMSDGASESMYWEITTPLSDQVQTASQLKLTNDAWAALLKNETNPTNVRTTINFFILFSSLRNFNPN
jgi:hypothetical protein